MRQRSLLHTAILLALAVPSLAAGNLRSTAAERGDLRITVTNQDLGLVQEARSVEVPAGESVLEFLDVPGRIDPRTLIVEVADGLPLVVREQHYEFDLLSRDRILEKYVGQELSWIQEDGRRIRGTLVGLAGGPVYRIDGEIVFDVPGRLALPELPADLRVRPTLVWDLSADRAGKRSLDVSYLTGGLSWSADYVLQLAPSEKEADLQGWVTLENRSGASYAGAQIMLLAGEIHRAPQPRRLVRGVEAAMAPDVASFVQESTAGDYHLYTIPWRTDLPDNSSKQVALLRAAGVDVTKRYRARLLLRGGSRPVGGTQNLPVMVNYELRLTERNGLGQPLPAGVVRVYGRTDAGGRLLLGEDRIGHTPVGEKISLRTGRAFDLVAEATELGVRPRGEKTVERQWRVELRNRSGQTARIELDVAIDAREWRILASNLEWEQPSAGTARFTAAVPAGGTVPVTWTVRITR